MPRFLRRSQFITTYGPGAILETPEGPRVIPNFEHSGLFTPNQPVDAFEITDQRLSETLLEGARILRVPSNAELGRPDSYGVFRTIRFPGWSLCVDRSHPNNVLYQKANSSRKSCPMCPDHRHENDAWQQANRQAIRFVRACEHGHLDDVDWVRVAHGYHSYQCSPPYLQWRGGGGSLRTVEIVCPTCGLSGNLGLAYGRDWPCSGRFPEMDNTRNLGTCPAPARMIQRGAANLRIAELISSLTIPPHETPLHRILETRPIKIALTSQINPISSKEELLQIVQNLVQRNLIHASVIPEFEAYSDEVIARAIEDVLTTSEATNPYEYRLEEFRALQMAAQYGAPQQPASTPGGPPQFEVLLNQIRIINGPNNRPLRITPINRLRVVMIQKGYRRLDPLNSIIERFSNFENQLWYPGVELFGEGIFIDLPPEVLNSRHDFNLSGSASYEWFNAWASPDQCHIRLDDPENRNQLHPVFVWWHTLAHRLINALAIDSGYSSASIRERIFIEVNDDGDAFGGILLYTVQPGGDGTLGGLVGLVSQFERILQVALHNIDACSNDPLCGEERFSANKYNGPACYACALVSETSCEHRNMRLDRKLLLDNLP